MAYALDTTTVPGYSPSPVARQDSPFLRTPGAQGLQEGVSQGQGLGLSPEGALYNAGFMAAAPPSSLPSGGMWTHFGGSGGASSSLTPQAGSSSSMGTQPAANPYANAASLVAALQGGNSGAQ